MKMEYEPIVTQRFKEVERQCGNEGTTGEFSNEPAARLAFAKALREQGYRREGNVWVDGIHAAVMVP